jgi:signal transduction histidine kinase
LDDFVPDLQKIFEAGTHLLSLINDILDLSKIEAGRMKLESDEIDIELLVENVASAAKPSIENNGNILEIECDRSAGIIHADLKKVRQVLMHLLSNAAKFTTNGTVKVSVRRIPGRKESNAAGRSGIENSMAAGETDSVGIACPLPNVEESIGFAYLLKIPDWNVGRTTAEGCLKLLCKLTVQQRDDTVAPDWG